MTLPPSSESGNVVDPEVLATRRARRAEVSEDATLELRLFEAERRLGEVAVERDRLRTRVAQVERELTVSRQREWAEQQERLEAQGETAVARDLAAEQLSSLRERLAEAEAELAVVAAERERARRALEDERLRVAAERERREALEREGLLLREELARRDDLTARAGAAVSAARDALAVREADESAREAGVEARLAAERSEFAARVDAVERAVLSVRERLGAAARVLKERLEAERRARAAAEDAADVARRRTAALEREQAAAGHRIAELDAALVAAYARTTALEQELERRARVESQLRAALAALEAELDSARADDTRMTRLTERVESVVDLATRLHGEASAEHDTLATLREQLETERAARWVAEAELDAERTRGATDRAARTAAEAELASLRTTHPAADPATLASLREALAHLTTAPSTPNPSLDVDLTAAAARLRAGADPEPNPLPAVEEPSVADELLALATPPAVEEPAAVEPPAFVAEPPASAVSPAVEESTAVESPVFVAEPPASAVSPAVEEPQAVEPPAFVAEPPALVAPPAVEEPQAVEPPADADPFVPTTAAPEPDHTAPAPSPAPRPRRAAAVPVPGPLPQRAPVAKPAPWLRDALRALARDEPDIAELLLLALLPAQAGIVRSPITYELRIADGTTHWVVVEPDAVRVELPRGDAPSHRIAGSLDALVPLVAGGAARRLPDTTIDGRRPLRRLLKARRAPVGLAELARKGVAPSPGLLLTVLARAVDPAWTKDRRLAVDVAAAGADRWRVQSSGDGVTPLTILPADDAPPADATLHTSAALLPAVLAGTAAPSQATVEGSLRDLRTLLSWLDRAQRGGR